MFTFLTRLGRLAIGIPVAVVVITVLGYTTLTMLPAASHHQASSATSCAASAAAVGQQLTISGTGYSPNTTYLVDITWPAGNTSGQSTVTNASGNLSAWNYAYYAGTYKIAVMTVGSHSTLMAACSTTV